MNDARLYPCVRGGQVHVSLSAGRDGVVGPAGRCCRRNVASIVERLGVDVDRPVGQLDYRFVVVGCSDCEFRCSV